MGRADAMPPWCAVNGGHYSSVLGVTDDRLGSAGEAMKVLSVRHAMSWVQSPRSWPEAGRRLSRARQGRRWCEPIVVPLEEAFALLGLAPPASTFETAYPELVREARERTERCGSRLGGPGNMTLLYWLCERLEATRVLETGVAYGWSSLALLTSLSTRSDGVLCSTDKPYPHVGDEGRDCVGSAVPDWLGDRWRIFRQADEEALDRILCELDSFDLAHHDSDKTYEGRMWAYPRLWESLQPGGVFICDDVGDNLAFRDFSSSLGVPPVIIRSGSKFQGVLKKGWSRREPPGSGGFDRGG